MVANNNTLSSSRESNTFYIPYILIDGSNNLTFEGIQRSVMT